VANYQSDREQAQGRAPLRRIPAHATQLTLSVSTTGQLSASALDDFVGDFVTLHAASGTVGVCIASSVAGVSFAECPIKVGDDSGDAAYEEFYVSQEDADTGLVYIADSGTPSLYLTRAKAHTG